MASFCVGSTKVFQTTCKSPSLAARALRARSARPQLTMHVIRGTSRRVLATQASSMPQAEITEEMSVVELKQALLDSFYGTDRGLSVSSDSRAEIVELITQLEANNPTPLPNDATSLLNGTWRLVYTSNSEVLALLALGRLPLVTVEDITQTVDGVAMTVENKVQLSGPLVRTSFATSASVEVRSPKLLQVQFQEGRVATPQILDDVALPTSLELLGQRVDLAPVQSVLQPLEGPVKGLLSQLGGVLARQSDLQFPIRSPRASTWLLNTYLDNDLRITRGDNGSVYVLVKDADHHSNQDHSSHSAAEAPAPQAATPAPAPTPANPVVEPSAVIEEGSAAEYQPPAGGASSA